MPNCNMGEMFGNKETCVEPENSVIMVIDKLVRYQGYNQYIIQGGAMLQTHERWNNEDL